MCSATDAQTNDLADQNELMTSLMSEAKQTFGDQQGILSQLSTAYQPIVAKGPSQEGFSAAEKNAMGTQADEGTAENFQQAQRAMKESEAAEGGGNTEIPSGAASQAEEALNAAAAGQRSQEHLGITEADYATGRQNFQQATTALEGTAGLENPEAFGSTAVGEGSAYGSEGNAIASQATSWMQPVLGAVGAVGAAAAGRKP